MILTANGASHSVDLAAESAPDPVPLDEHVDGHSRSHGGHPTDYLDRIRIGSWIPDFHLFFSLLILLLHC